MIKIKNRVDRERLRPTGWHQLRWVLWATVAACTIAAPWAEAQDRTPRAERPDWSAAPGTEVFFDDAFTEALQGEPPAWKAVAARSSDDTQLASASWSPWLPSDIIEDEIKAMYLALLPAARNRSAFRRANSQIILAMLAAWFGVVAEYDGEIRWKASAAAARDRFREYTSRSPESLFNSYDEVKSAVDDLQQLLEGGELSDTSAAEEFHWPQIASRSRIMQRWEWATRDRLAPWLADASAFENASDSVRHEAGVLAAMAEVLLKDGMDEATDTEYRDFALRLKRDGIRMLQAAADQDFASAAAAHVDIDRVCNQCHEIYR